MNNNKIIHFDLLSTLLNINELGFNHWVKSLESDFKGSSVNINSLSSNCLYHNNQMIQAKIKELYKIELTDDYVFPIIDQYILSNKSKNLCNLAINARTTLKLLRKNEFRISVSGNTDIATLKLIAKDFEILEFIDFFIPTSRVSIDKEIITLAEFSSTNINDIIFVTRDDSKANQISNHVKTIRLDHDEYALMSLYLNLISSNKELSVA